jgi:hypothetical protein
VPDHDLRRLGRRHVGIEREDRDNLANARTVTWIAAPTNPELLDRISYVFDAEAVALDRPRAGVSASRQTKRLGRKACPVRAIANDCAGCPSAR